MDTPHQLPFRSYEKLLSAVAVARWWLPKSVVSTSAVAAAWRNSKCTGVGDACARPWPSIARLLHATVFCNERAAATLRRDLGALMVVGGFAAAVATRASGGVDGGHAVARRAPFVALCTCAAVGVPLVASFLVVPIAKWHAHLRPQPPQPHDPPFLESHIAIDGGGDGRLAFLPVGVSPVSVAERSMSLYGMSLQTFVATQLTVGLEYARNIVARAALLYGRCGRFGRASTSAKEFYQAMINTAMVCWLDEDSGHLEFASLRLPTDSCAERFVTIERLSIELDHARGEFVAMVVDGERVEDVDEAAAVAIVVAALYAHPHVHLWANGTAQLEGSWALAAESTAVTQWMNFAATFSSPYFFGNSVACMASILGHNTAQGMPVHSGARLRAVAERSLAHRMIRKARAAIKAERPEWSSSQLEAVMAATLMHSADHYYADKFLGFHSQSSVLRADFSLFRISLVGPNVYHTRKLLCRERLDDPIARALFTAAMEVDPEFAEHGLFFACAT